jgi:hypothetical protein
MNASELFNKLTPIKLHGMKLIIPAAFDVTRTNIIVSISHESSSFRKTYFMIDFQRIQWKRMDFFLVHFIRN